MRREKFLFLAKFFGTLIAAYVVVALRPVNDHVVVPFTAAIAGLAGAILNAGGEGVLVKGTAIISPRFSVNVNNGCNGIEAMLILLAAIVAFRAPMRARVVGLLLGAAIVQVLNQVRIITLYLVGAHEPQLFDLFHTAIWQVIVIGAAVVFFVVWSIRVGPARLPSRA